MKDAYYFSHDSNARHDPRIIKLRRQYGAEGYGVFFMLVEILREQDDYTLDFNDESIMDIAYELQWPYQIVYLLYTWPIFIA